MAALQGINPQTTALAGLNGSVNGTSAVTNAVKAGQTTSSNLAASDLATSNSSTIKDQASVSTTGGLVAQALTTSDVRQEKVAALQSAIASGSYNVPSSAVASKIVDSLLK